jgi:hypothetical protein
MRQRQQDAQLSASDRSNSAAPEIDCFSAQEVAMAAAAAVFGGDDDRCVAIHVLLQSCCGGMAADAPRQGRIRCRQARANRAIFQNYASAQKSSYQLIRSCLKITRASPRKSTRSSPDVFCSRHCLYGQIRPSRLRFHILSACAHACACCHLRDHIRAVRISHAGR